MDFELTNHAAKRMEERGIESHWIDRALTQPDQETQDSIDPDIRHALKQIKEMDHRVLRVVYNAVVSPIRVISVFFDRGMKGKL